VQNSFHPTWEKIALEKRCRSLREAQSFGRRRAKEKKPASIGGMPYNPTVEWMKSGEKTTLDVYNPANNGKITTNLNW